MPTSTVRRAAAGAFVAALATTWLTGCGSDGSYDYAQICRDNKTGQRLPDSYCQPGYHSSGGIIPIWYWYPLSHSGAVRLPGVGERVPTVSGGTYSRPSTGRVATGISEHGTSVSRGGFGHGGHSGSSGE